MDSDMYRLSDATSPLESKNMLQKKLLWCYWEMKLMLIASLLLATLLPKIDAGDGANKHNTQCNEI